MACLRRIIQSGSLLVGEMGSGSEARVRDTDFLYKFCMDEMTVSPLDSSSANKQNWLAFCKRSK